MRRRGFAAHPAERGWLCRSGHPLNAALQKIRTLSLLGQAAVETVACRPSLAAALFILVAATPLGAASVKVSSLPALERALAMASPGDQIRLADGSYTSPGAITITNAGTTRRPILLAAETIGGAEIKGEGGFVLASPASHIVLQGFKFTHAGTVQVGVGATHCRVTRNLFELANTGKAPYLQVAGDDNEIDFNTFQNKSNEGEMLTIQGPGTNGMAQRTWVHHNYFYHFVPTANNCSAIQIGLSSRSMSSAFSLVEHNLFIDTRGENEGGICNKSCDNIYRFNTFGQGCRELSLRHGNRCQVYANFFIGSEGIRFFGRDHKIFSNYFEQCRPAINIGDGDAIIPPGGLRMHDRPDGVQVVFNTLVSNRVNVVMADRRRAFGATNFVFANNIIVGGGEAVSIKGPLAAARWEGNIIWGDVRGAGDLPAAGYVSMDPKLTRDTTCRYHLETSNPALGKAAGSYPFVTVDIDGQPRGPKKDIGADERSTAPSRNRILTPADVGPHAPNPTSPQIWPTHFRQEQN